MAIKKTVTTPHGIEVANAYHRVEAVSLPDKSSVSFLLEILQRQFRLSVF